MTIKAIETAYKGYRFRSRLEARWAVFFDALGIEWQYEPEGFELPGGLRYLPDFFLPGFHQAGGIYVEVKHTEGDLTKPRALARVAKVPVLLAVGAPDCRVYELALIDATTPDWMPPVSYTKAVAFTTTALRERRLWEEPTEAELEDEAILVAVYAARGARFEFGESGAWRK